MLYPREYLQFVELFNEEKFFEAHEILEVLWKKEKGAVRSFYQGMIQAAACCVHLQRGNQEGAQRLLETSSQYLAPYGSYFMGLEIVKFLNELNSAQLAQTVYPRIYLK